MPPKRKAAGQGEGFSTKRSRRGLDDDQTHADNPFHDDESDDGPTPDEWLEAIDEFCEDKRVWICGYVGCGHRTDRLQKIQNHVRTHTKERPFICGHPGCDKDFTRKDHLDRHVKSHGEGIPRPVACTWEGCTKRFQTRQHLDRHYKTHEKKFYCTGYPPCKEIFRKEKTLEEHVLKEHLNTYPYACGHVDEKTGERCTKAYLKEGHLRSHIQSCHSEKEKEAIYFCSLCPAPGSEMETVETEHGVVTIAKEALAFSSYKELSAHNKEQHPPTCSECGRKFKDKHSLDGHFDTVHSQRPDKPQYPCAEPDCGRVFKTSWNLKAHIRSVHEQRRNFICSASSFTDTNKEDLKAWSGHDACGMAFCAKSTLEQHVRTQHINFLSRKQARQEAKSKKKSKAMPKPSALRMLTGIGYDGGRTIACLAAPCGDMFYMDRDLRRHLRSVHKWEDPEITEKMLERDALQGGEFWVRRSDDLVFDSADTSIPQTPDLSQDAAGNPLARGFDESHIDPALGAPLAQMKLASVAEAEEEAQMDMEMGLGALQTWNMENGLPGA